MKQSRTTIKELTARYRAVLLKCALINAMMFMGIGAANAAGINISAGDTLIINTENENSFPAGFVKNPNDESMYTYDSLTIGQTNGEKAVYSQQGTKTADELSILFTGNVSANNAEINISSGRFDTTGSATIKNSTINVSDFAETHFDGSTNVFTDVTVNLSSNGSLDAEGTENTFENTTINFKDKSLISDDFLSGERNMQELVSFGTWLGSLGNGDSLNFTGTSKINTHNEKTVIGVFNAVSLADNSELNVNGNTHVISLYEEAFIEQGKVALKDNAKINLNGRLHADITATGGNVVFNNSAARLNGELSGSGVNLTFNDNYLFSNINNKASLNTVTIAAGKTLDIGSGTLTATNFTGGTISAVLTDAAKNAAIITGNATNVTLALDMTNASRDEVTQYHITNGTGFTFADYAANRYAVSGTDFDIADAAGLGVLTGWNGGDLYILRLATAGEAAVEDLQKAGVNVSLAEQNAIKALDLAQSVLSKLDTAKQEAIARVNDLLDKAAGKVQETKQILREIAPDASQSGTKTAANTAKSVINVIGARLGGGSSGNMRGRSGGDLFAGRSAVWAQGMYNKAELDKENGFKSDSTGFAAGIETNLTDSLKAGIGYAFTKTDIDTDRSQTDVDTHTGFVYGEYKPNKLYVNAIASFGYSKYDDTTNLLGLTSDYKADTIGAQIAAGYELGILTPEAALRYTHVKQDDHTDALGATVRSKSFDTWTVAGGVKLAKKFTPKDNRHISITPELKLAATYDFERDDETNTVVLADGSSYIAESDMMKRFGIEAGANIGMTIGNNSEITLSYEGKFKKDYQDHTGLINFKYLF